MLNVASCARNGDQNITSAERERFDLSENANDLGTLELWLLSCQNKKGHEQLSTKKSKYLRQLEWN